jgi:hypothetical protein
LIFIVVVSALSWRRRRRNPSMEEMANSLLKVTQVLSVQGPGVRAGRVAQAIRALA